MDSDDGLVLNARKIVGRAGKLMWKKRMPVFLILVAFLVPRFALVGAYLLNIGSLVIKLQGVLETSRPMVPESILGIVLDGLKKFIVADVGIFLAFILLSALLSLTVIYTVEMDLKQKEMTFKNLMLKIWKTLKGVVATMIYFHFLVWGYLGFSSLLILAIILGGDLSVGSFFLASLMTILSLILLVYFEFVWFQGVVVSVMETGCNGLSALGKSADLIQERRALAFRVNLLLSFLIGFVAFFNSLAVSHFLKGGARFMVLEFIFQVIIFAMEVFKLIVYAVFYHECSNKTKGDLAMQEKLIYSKVSSGVPLREDVP